MPVDTTGAGDCFNAGLIAGLLRGLGLPDAATLGCAVGASGRARPRNRPAISPALKQSPAPVVSTGVTRGSSTRCHT